MHINTPRSEFIDPLASFFTLLKKRMHIFCLSVIIFFIIGALSIPFLPKTYQGRFIFLTGLYQVESPFTTVAIFHNDWFREQIAQQYLRHKPKLSDPWFNYTLHDRGQALDVLVYARDPKAVVILGTIIQDEIMKRHRGIIDQEKKQLDFFKKKYADITHSIAEIEKKFNIKNDSLLYSVFVDLLHMKYKLEIDIRNLEETIKFREPSIDIPLTEPTRPWQPNIPVLFILIFAGSLTFSSIVVSVYDRFLARKRR